MFFENHILVYCLALKPKMWNRNDPVEGPKDDTKTQAYETIYHLA